MSIAPRPEPEPLCASGPSRGLAVRRFSRDRGTFRDVPVALPRARFVRSDVLIETLPDLIETRAEAATLARPADELA